MHPTDLTACPHCGLIFPAEELLRDLRRVEHICQGCGLITKPEKV